MTRSNEELNLGANSSDYSIRYTGIVKGDRYNPQLHQVEAIHTPTGNRAGYLKWAANDSSKSTPIYDITTLEKHQRKGVATAMFNFAVQLAAEGKTNPVHLSQHVTPKGHMWARFMATGQKGKLNYRD